MREQLESIVTQNNSDTYLLARDDGSTDRTLEILLEFSEKYDRFEIASNSGVRLGISQSFLSLVHIGIARHPKYISFCDQDDVWIKDRFVEADILLSRNGPELLIGSVELIDAELNFISGTRSILEPINPCLSIFANQAIGCSIVINLNLAEELSKSSKYFNDNILHDWRIFILASFYGEIIITNNVWVRYRQHPDNVIGYSRGFKRFLVFFRSKGLASTSNFNDIARSILRYRLPEMKKYRQFLMETSYIETIPVISRILYIRRWRLSRSDFLGRLATWVRILLIK